MKRTKLAVTSTAEAYAAAAKMAKPGVAIVEILHDSWCKAQRTQRDADCTCKPDFYLVQPFAKGRDN